MVCNKVQLKKIAIEFVKKLESKGITVERLILFGSYARGNARGTSDIDFAVVSQKFRRLSDIRRIEILTDIARCVCPDMPISIDVIGFTVDEFEEAGYFHIASQIKDEGKTLYKAA